MVTDLFDSAYDVLERAFESPKVKMHIMKWCAELMMAPEVKGTGIVPLLLFSVAHIHRAANVVGGTANLTRTLVRCIEHYGGEVRTECEVARINVSRRPGARRPPGGRLHDRCEGRRGGFGPSVGRRQHD